MSNEYVPFKSKITEVIKHTDIEYTFRMTYDGDVRPGQFFEVSLPKYGEAPISVSGLGDGTVDLTIRRVGRVTDEVFEHYVGDTLFLRGPYGNGFNVENYMHKDLLVIAGGTGLSPVRGLIEYFADNPEQVKSMTLIAGFKTPKDILFFDDFGKWKKSMNVILTVDCADDEDTSCQIGLVTEHLKRLSFTNIKEAVAVVVGPPLMMHFSTLGLLELGFEENNIWISHERKMCCGIGKCGHCKINDKYVCLDGPVFNFSQAESLID